MSADPVYGTTSTNSYSYALGNPIHYYDTRGLQVTEVLSFIGEVSPLLGPLGTAASYIFGVPGAFLGGYGIGEVIADVLDPWIWGPGGLADRY